MAHLTCIAHTREQLAEIVAEYKDAGIDNLLALAGDPPQDVDDYPNELEYATDLIELIDEHDHFSVGVAAHPELHPRSPDRETDRRYLARKLARADFGITQFFFEAEPYLRMIDDLDALGNITPVLGVDSHWSLILAYLSGITLHIWTIKGYFDSIDPALDKAAQIDGATPWQTFRYVFLPMSVPILAVVFVLSFIFLVTEYPSASVILRTNDQLTLAVGARQYLYEQRYLWGDFAAAAILSGLPITIVFLFAQRYLVSGLSEGGVKG
jgi:hypothetical protein